MIMRFSLFRDAILVLVGATFMYFVSIFAPIVSRQTFINAVSLRTTAPDRSETGTLIHSTSSAVAFKPSASPVPSLPSSNLASDLPETSIIAHAPGWTLFRNLYMSNSTFFIVSDSPSDFPEIRLMASNPVPAENTPENIALREPTADNMAVLTSAEAKHRWSDDNKARILSVEGNTVLVNEPSQFLRHYYHLVAELFFGIQAFWHGAFSTPSYDPDRDYILGPYPAPPPIHRVIFARTDAAGWRDDPGYNVYVMRAAFPATSIEEARAWEDRAFITSSGDRAWHFPLLLLTDRSASHRGRICGSQTQRIASEAVEAMRHRGQLVGARVGGWWEPVRSAVLRFARAELPASQQDQAVLSNTAATGKARLPTPANIVITYTSRQIAGHRKLTPESHAGLVQALKELVQRKGWELNVMEPEKLSKEEQLSIIARTTILVGVHGNGLSHLVMLPPNRFSSVVEIFYPLGFAHDYQWTAKALGMRHFTMWNDTYRTEGVGEGKPDYAYPEGFQGNSIPVHGPAVAQLIEDHIEGRV
ncbi:hypothetical protein MSAN_01869900 [Mycena sanguinolenta]|uniref:Glycosyltransferase 61 catalytic domain-containing protein n=1 Tax=Mycena sanguinolenta TaxID=230812 RepID=A0A8H7CQH1_9AGAR|nr:hypothetical protein MSAN_01869900 [Mycena sanguinolenta]